MDFRERALATRPEDPAEAKFFEKLQERRCVTYDWHKDTLLVIEDPGDESKQYSLRSAAFLHHTGGDELALTSADLVILLLRIGLQVEVRNHHRTFHDQAEFQARFRIWEAMAETLGVPP